MKKIVKSVITLTISIVGLVGGFIWAFLTKWNESHPIILMGVAGLEIIGFIIYGFDDENSTANSSVINAENVTFNMAPESSQKTDVEEKQKSQTRILFIDDNHTDFKMVSILKKSGWVNTKSVKDVTDLDDPKVLEADIVFVDINGVGITLFQDQGLGLASALKKKYNHKKVVIYSVESTGDRFHKALREVDDCLSKNAEPYQFINLIEEFSKN